MHSPNLRMVSVPSLPSIFGRVIFFWPMPISKQCSKPAPVDDSTGLPSGKLT